MGKKPKVIDDISPDATQRGLDDRDFGRAAPKEPDPDTATEEEIADFMEQRDAFDSRDDMNEDGETKEDERNAART